MTGHEELCDAIVHLGSLCRQREYNARIPWNGTRTSYPNSPDPEIRITHIDVGYSGLMAHADPKKRTHWDVDCIPDSNFSYRSFVTRYPPENPQTVLERIRFHIPLAEAAPMRIPDNLHHHSDH